jgi:hypothetical protein
MIYFTELDFRRQGDMAGVLLLSPKNPITGR